MSAHPIGAESFESEVFDTPPWPADEKVIAEELGPYLAGARRRGDVQPSSLGAPGARQVAAQRAAWLPSRLAAMDGRGLDEQRLRLLLEVGTSIVAELDSEAVLQRVLEAGRELTGARYAAVGILDQERKELERFLTAGIDESTRRAIGELPRGGGILGELIRHPEPLRLADISQHPRSYGFPPEHPPMTTFLGAPVLVRGEAWGNIYLTEKEGGEFDEADEQALLVLARWVAIAIENSHLYEDIDARRGELERAVSGLEATVAITRAVGGETDLSRVLELVVKRGRALVDARHFLVLLAEDAELVVAAAAGETGDEAVGTRLPAAQTALGEVLRTGHAERLTEMSSRMRLGLGELADRAAMAMLVPLSFHGRGVGVLVALDRFDSDRAVQRRGRATHARVRRQRRHGSGHRPDRRGGAAADEHRVRRPGARPLGTRASRRDAPGTRRAPGDPHDGPQAGGPSRSERRPNRRSGSSRPRSPSSRA